MAGEVKSSTAAGISVTTALVGFILGVIVTTIILLRFKTLYMRLENLLKITKTDTDHNTTKDCTNPTSLDFSSYSEIDDIKRNSHFGASNIKQHSNPKRYTEESVQYEEYDVKKYTNLSTGGKGSNKGNYENIELHTCDTKPETRLSRSATEYIIEPGTNKRLMVKMFDNDTLPPNEDHVYFKLEPGSDRVVPVPRNDVGRTQEPAGSRMSDPHTYFILEKTDNVHNLEFVNSCFSDNNEPKYFILEKTT